MPKSVIVFSIILLIPKDSFPLIVFMFEIVVFLKTYLVRSKFDKAEYIFKKYDKGEIFIL